MHRAGSGPSVVLIHGASGTASSWELVADAWSWADVHAIALPGREGSDAIDHHHVEDLAAWLLAWLRALEIRPWLVGHSLGGGLALRLALDAPEAIAGVAMVSSSARLRVAPALLEAVSIAGPEAPLDFEFAFGPDASPELRQAYAERVRQVPNPTGLCDWQSCDNFDVRERLAKVEVPVTVIYGERDPLTPPKHQRSLVEALPRGREVVVAGAGHMLPWEAPEAVAAGVRESVD
nr:alpha/beta hydrolase [Pseudenhygromyxa sp. WMMC2535]